MYSYSTLTTIQTIRQDSNSKHKPTANISNSEEMLIFYFISQTKWCPAPGCEYAVDYVIGSDNFDVTCRCTHYFCWNVSIKHLLFPFLNKHEIRGYQSLKYIFDYMLLQCTQEAHRPMDCDTVGKWILKNSAESENTNWYDFFFSFFW